MLNKSHRKGLRIAGITGAVILVLLILLHIWFSYNAKYILQNEVRYESKGKLSLKVKHFSFNYFTRHIEVRTAFLQSTDTLTQPATYKVQFGKLDLQVTSFWPLLFKRKLLIDSIKLYNPQFSIYRWRVDSTTPRKDVSIPREMGRLYNSMLDALNTFGIKRIIISNGRFMLVNKMDPGSKPIVISNIFFNLIRNGNEVESNEYVAREQTIDLSTTNQHITLPNGRHQLSFRNFKLQLFKRRIELDSCTITAQSSDSARSRYTVFFNKLMLVNVDFDALYRYNLIKADSVYCLQPRFQVQLATFARPEKKEKSTGADPKKLLEELAGNLELGYVGVKKAGIHINITGNKTRTFFNSNQDDFEVRGLRVNADSATPVVVNRFDMLVRDYRLYNKDSSSTFRFDSIHVLDNKITLSNFSVTTASSPNEVRSIRDFKIPYFQLIGLNWYDLIFDQNLTAEEAILYNPVIYYKAKPKTAGRRPVGIFHALQTLDSLMTLRKIGFINGQVNMILNPATSFNLQNASIVLNSNDLLESKNATGIKESVELLRFSKGIFHIKDVTAKLTGVNYTGKNLMHMQELAIDNASNTVQAVANDVWLENLFLDEASASVKLKGVRWNNATVALQGIKNTSPSTKQGTARLSVQNLSGANTAFTFTGKGKKLHAYINTVAADNIEKEANKPVTIDNLQLNGQQLTFSNGATTAAVRQYTVRDKAPSVFTSVRIEKETPTDTVRVTVPRIVFTPDINSVLAKNTYVPSVQLLQPDIYISKTVAANSTDERLVSPGWRIGHMAAAQPSLEFTLSRSDSIIHIALPRCESGRLEITGLQHGTKGWTADQLELHNEALTYTKPNGEIIGVKEGTISTTLSDIQINAAKGKPVWSALVHSFQIDNPYEFTVGKNKNKLSFSSGSFGNLRLSSSYIGDFSKLLKNNLAIWLRTKNGQYIDSATTIKWFNSDYDATKKRVTLDSFLYRPTPSRDSVMANSTYQTDYITLTTGHIDVTDFNLEKYSKDSAMQAGTIAINQPTITIYRDKRLPFKAGAVKPLPTAMIQQLNFPVQIKKIELRTGYLSYTELSGKTGAEGTVTLSDIKATLSHIKNRNLKTDDSLKLSLDAYLLDSAKIRLRVHEAYLDSLNTFRMTLRMTPTSLNFLNSVLVPLSNVKIVSGKIDSLQLRALGQEYLALGEMAMYYHNLKIQLVKDGNPDKTTFLTRTVSFLANTFIIKKNNNGRRGLAYFERLRNRSFFNYIIKITFSGMATNIGAKSNKKYMRKYRKMLDQQQLPPLDFDLLEP